jgi:SAM-dependent methyltransferase
MAQPDDAPRLAPEILDHYREVDEGGRLDAGSGPLEFARTREVVRRRLAAGALDVIDIGGGTGVHAAWLARDGHRVELVDPVAEHVARAGEQGARSNPRFTAHVGDARQLPFGDERFDVALLRDIETERCIVEASAHVLAIGTKPG